MVKCSAPMCYNASYRKIPEITFHRFPKEENLRNLWIKNTNRKDWQPNLSSVLCSKHFEDKYIDSSVFRTVLTPGAIPTIFEKLLSSEENIKDSHQTSASKSVEKQVGKLKSRIIQKDRKIKCCQKKNRRLRKKVKQFSDTIVELRKKL